MADPLTLASEIATILQTASLAGPTGERGRRASVDSRERSYIRFQQAAVDLALWAAELQAFSDTLPAVQRVPVRLLAVGASLMPFAWAGKGLNTSAVADIAKYSLLAAMFGDVQREQTVVQQAGSVRSAVSNLLGSLGEIRLCGSAEPREYAERITALLGELFTIPGKRPTKPLRGLPWLRAREAACRHQREAYDDYARALGEAHRDFILAARDDLGRGRRWWQSGRERARKWQFWRRTRWPGGWPGPEAAVLVAESRRRAITTTRDTAREERTSQ